METAFKSPSGLPCAARSIGAGAGAGGADALCGFSIVGWTATSLPSSSATAGHRLGHDR